MDVRAVIFVFLGAASITWICYILYDTNDKVRAIHRKMFPKK
jgi:hypothetical protein